MADRYIISTVFKILDQATAPIRKIGRGFGRLNVDVKKLQASLKKTGDQMTKMGKTMSTRVTLPMVAGMGLALRAFNKQAQAVEQVRVGIEATGGAAGRSMEQLRSMANRLQSETLFGDEEILAGATAQLLTFTNIAGDQFDRTQQAVLDVATRLSATRGGAADLTGTSIMLGKALNDPVANMGALSRSGIQFSKDQKEVIKSLWESGQRAKAQSLILEELEKQYGGSAAAAAKAGTGGLKQLSNAFGDLTEDIGALLYDMLKPLIATLKEVVAKAREWVKENPKLAKQLIKIAGVVAVIGPALIAIGLAVKVIAPLITVFKGIFLAGKVLIPIIAMVGKVGVVAILGITKALIGMIVAGGPIIWILTAIIGIATLIIYNWDTVKKFFIELWASVVKGAKWLWKKVSGFFSELWDDLTGGVMEWVNLLTTDPLEAFKQMGLAMLDFLMFPFKKVWEFANWLGKKLGSLWDSLFGEEKTTVKIKTQQKAFDPKKLKESIQTSSKTEVDINLKADKGTEASVEKVKQKGKDKPTVRTQSAIGKTSPVPG